MCVCFLPNAVVSGPVGDFCFFGSASPDGCATDDLSRPFVRQSLASAREGDNAIQLPGRSVLNLKSLLKHRL